MRERGRTEEEEEDQEETEEEEEELDISYIISYHIKSYMIKMIKLYLYDHHISYGGGGEGGRRGERRRRRRLSRWPAI